MLPAVLCAAEKPSTGRMQSAGALSRNQGEIKRGTRLGHVPLDISGSTLPPE
jgi:hypothetical protein